MGSFWVRVAVLAVLLVAATAFALVRRRRAGVLREVPRGAEGEGQALTASDLGAPLGATATLVQFSTPVCRDCKATARMLAVVAGERPGVVHVEVDAEQRLDLARRFSVMRAPTTLVMDGAGNVVQRASGVPDRQTVLSTLDSLVGSTS